MAASDDWCYSSPLRTSKASRRCRPVRPSKHRCHAADAGFPLPTLGEIERNTSGIALRARLRLNSRTPVDEFGNSAAIAFWAVGQHLGDDVLSQSTDMCLDMSRISVNRAATPAARTVLARGNSLSRRLQRYCWLACMEVSGTGGESSLVSSVAVYNEMLAPAGPCEVLSQPLYRAAGAKCPLVWHLGIA